MTQKGPVMTKLFLLAALITFLSTAGWAQVPNPCPPGAASSSAGSATTGASKGEEPPKQQPVERSAILPDAGGEGQSAAPTVQQNGKSVEAQTECPKPPNQLNSKSPS